MDEVLKADRIARGPFFAFNVVLTMGWLLANDIIGKGTDTGAVVIGLSIGAILLVLNIILVTKRLRDLNRSAWWVLAFLGFEIARPFITATGHSDPSGPLMIIAIPVILAALVFGLMLTFQPGTKGHNRFGPDPKEKHLLWKVAAEFE